MFVFVFCAFYYMMNRCGCKGGLVEGLMSCEDQACFDSEMLKIAYTHYMSSRSPNDLQGLLKQVNTSVSNTNTQCC